MVRTVILLSIVVFAAVCLLLVVRLRNARGEARRRPEPDAVPAAVHVPVPRAPIVRPTPAVLGVPVAAGPPVAAGVPDTLGAPAEPPAPRPVRRFDNSGASRFASNARPTSRAHTNL